MKNWQLVQGLGLATAVSVIVSQPAISQVTQITDVKLNSTANGLQVLLETTATSPRIVTSNYDQTLLIDLFNTQLDLAEGEQFRSDNPAQGITSVTVKRLYNNSIRITVVGKTELPKVEVASNSQGVALSLTTSTSISQGSQPSEPSPTSPAPSEAAPTETVPPTSSQTPPSSEAEPADSAEESPEVAEDEQDTIEIVVTGRQEGRYTAPNATTATKTDTPLRDIPQSIQVIPQEVIEDQRVTRIADALRNVSGVTPKPGYGGSNDNYTIRGFEASTNLRNGFRDDGFLSFSDPATIERVEVLKGPASVLYGQFEPGGVVNYVTKRPLSEPYYAGEFTVGSYSFYRPSIDISGPLNTDKSLLYRFNVAYENSGSFRDFVNSEVFVAAPVLTYKISDSTNLTLDYEYAHIDRTFDRGLPPIQSVFDLPINRFLGEPSDSYTLSLNKPGYILEHRFNDNWQIRNAFSAQIAEAERSNAQGRSFQVENDGRTFRRRYTRTDEKAENYSLQTDLIGRVNTGSITHDLVVGLELSRSSYDYNLRRTNFTSIDIFNPVYGSPIPQTFSDSFVSDSNLNNVGIYLQDQITLQPNLKVLVGGRFDFSESNNDENNNGELVNSNQSYNVFSPRVGIVYQPTEALSLYASYSRSFKPDILSRTVDGNLLEPQRGTQYEVGLKAELLDGRLSSTIAAYDLTKTNVATTDPLNTDFTIAAGEVKSRGIELDVVGRLSPGWNLIASYGLNDSYVSKDNTFEEGSRLINAPRNTASLWTSYEIQKGSLSGLGFGAGIFFVDEREAELPNNLKIPSYIRTDASIFYRRDNYKIGLNFKNLFDTKYYDSQGFLIYPGAPLTVLGTFSLQF